MKDVDLFDVLDKKGIINKAEPIWWDEDYKDPREVLTLNSFEKNLRLIGNFPISGPKGPVRDIYVYQSSTGKVPIVDIEIFGSGFNIPFLITVRPFTYQERDPYWKMHNDSKRSHMLRGQHALVSEAKRLTKELGYWSTKSNIMYLPHIRGILKQKIGKKHIFYPIKITDFIRVADPENKGKVDLIYFPIDTKELHETLKPMKLDYLIVFNNLVKNPVGERAHQALNEMSEQKAVIIDHTYTDCDTGKWHYVPLSKTLRIGGLEEVVYNEFKPGQENRFSYYPIKIPEFEYAMPIAFSTNIGEWCKEKGIFVLGLFWEYNKEKNQFRFLPFINKDVARAAAERLSSELGMQFDYMTMKRKRGFCRYHIHKLNS